MNVEVFDPAVVAQYTAEGFWDDESIAQRIAFTAAPGAFSFKTAYAEEFAKRCPGVLLEVENIRRVHALPQIRWMDSCTRHCGRTPVLA